MVLKSPDQMGIFDSFFFDSFAQPAVKPNAPIPADIVPSINFLLLNKFLYLSRAWEDFCFSDLSFLSDIIILFPKICIYFSLFEAKGCEGFYTQQAVSLHFCGDAFSFFGGRLF